MLSTSMEWKFTINAKNSKTTEANENNEHTTMSAKAFRRQPKAVRADFSTLS